AFAHVHREEHGVVPDRRERGRHEAADLRERLDGERQRRLLLELAAGAVREVRVAVLLHAPRERPVAAEEPELLGAAREKDLRPVAVFVAAEEEDGGGFSDHAVPGGRRFTSSGTSDGRRPARRPTGPARGAG